MRQILRLTTCTFLPLCRSPSAQQLGGRNFCAPTGGLFATCLILLLPGPPGDVATEGTWAWGLSPCSTEQLSWVLWQDLTSPELHPVQMKPHSPHPPRPRRTSRGSGCCGGSLGTGQRGRPVQHCGEGGKIQGRCEQVGWMRSCT